MKTACTIHSFPWASRICYPPGIALAGPCLLRCLGGTGDALSTRGRGKCTGGAQGGSCWSLEEGWSLWVLGKQIGGLKPGAGASGKAEAPRLRAGNERRTRSSCQVDQGHLQIKVSPCFFLPQPPYPTISVDSDPGTLGRTFSSRWSHLLPKFSTL